MRIRSPRMVRQEPSPKGFRTIAKFNLEVTTNVTVCDCCLVQAPDGRVMLYGPGRESGALSVAPETRREIIEMALAAMGMETNGKQAV